MSMPTRTIWFCSDSPFVEIIDQRALPHQLVYATLRTCEDAVTAIRDMWVRGAPLIGATAACGLYLAALEAEGRPDADSWLRMQCERMREARPTAINLRWAVDRVEKAWQSGNYITSARETALALIEEDVVLCHSIGLHGLALIREIAARKSGAPVNVLTHCNAGRMACIEWGTATAPVYLAHNEGIPVHVWVDETRPRNQGASITAWELGAAGVPHTLIADNTGGHLMQHGQVDICIVGTDRTTRTGDVANKIGTYLKALAAFDNQVPFYVALPSPSIDWSLREGLLEIPIEMRSPEEITHIEGWDEKEARTRRVRLSPEGSPAANYGFDVTPARLITGLITERGVCSASEKGLTTLFPEKNKVKSHSK